MNEKLLKERIEVLHKIIAGTYEDYLTQLRIKVKEVCLKQF